MPEVIKRNANDILAELIDERGLKKKFVADKLNMSQASFSALLHGNIKFTADTAIKLGKILNVEYSIFLDESYS